MQNTVDESFCQYVLAGEPLVRVIATHCHPDHVGLAGWLCERFAAPFWTTTGEFGFKRMMAAALPGVDGPSAIPLAQPFTTCDEATIAPLAGSPGTETPYSVSMPITRRVVMVRD